MRGVYKEVYKERNKCVGVNEIKDSIFCVKRSVGGHLMERK